MMLQLLCFCRYIKCMRRRRCRVTRFLSSRRLCLFSALTRRIFVLAPRHFQPRPNVEKWAAGLREYTVAMRHADFDDVAAGSINRGCKMPFRSRDVSVIVYLHASWPYTADAWAPARRLIPQYRFRTRLGQDYISRAPCLAIVPEELI